MKRTVSTILVIAILVSTIISVTFVPFQAYALEARSNENEVVETEATVEETQPEQPLVTENEVPETTEVPEMTEEVEEPEVTEAIEENTPAHNEQVLDFLPTLLDEYEVTVIPYVYEEYDQEIDAEAFMFNMKEMYARCMRLDPNVKICVVECAEDASFYLVVEWSNGGRGYTPVDNCGKEDNYNFVAIGEHFRRMISKSFVSGVEMY